MAMTRCSECGRDVSDKAPACPNCGNPLAAASQVSSPTAQQSGVPQHLTKSALTARFANITEQVPQAIRGHVGAGEIVLYFNYIDKKGGCSSGKTAQQWIMVTNARVAYRAALEEKVGSTKTFVESSGSILLPQISYVGMTKGNETQGCSNVAIHKLQINSSGGTIAIAMPSEAHVMQARQFIESVLNPH